MTEQAAMTASKLMTLSTRRILRMTYPGPAKDFPKQPMMIFVLCRIEGMYDGTLDVEDKVALVVDHEDQRDEVGMM